jgi:hypothetical protein
VSLRCLAATPERGGLGGVEVLVDSDAVSGVGVSGGGWLAASGLREAHPESPASTKTKKTIISVDLKEPISGAASEVGHIRELHCWANCCRGVAAFTGGP